MDIKLDLSPEKIEQAVTDAVLASSLGVTIETTIAQVLNGYESKRIWENAIKDEVQRVANIEARRIIEENASVIQEHVRKEIDEESVRQITSRMIEWLWRDDR